MSGDAHSNPLWEKLEPLMRSDPKLLMRGDDIPERHRTDWTGPPAIRPLALARPQTVEQVSAILAACFETRTPIVPQGGLTGLVGGARPVSAGIALSLERMSAVEEVDALAGVMVACAGTPLQVAQEAAERVGMSVPLDLGSRGSCTIGGNISTNAGGNRVIRYGPMREQVLGLEVVLPDGTIVTDLNKLVKNNTGYDLKHLFIGAEGTLGVITRAVLKLQPKPHSVSVALCAVADYDALLGLLAGLRAQFGPGLTSFEAMWPEYWETMTGLLGTRSPFTEAHGAYAIVEFSGFGADSDAERMETVLGAMLEAGVLADAVVAQSDRDAATFWRVREAVGELRTLLGPVVSFDIGIQARDTGAFVAEAKARVEARWSDAVFLAYGHLGDNNIHLIAHVPGSEDAFPKDAIEQEVYGVVPRFGGSVSAEHGIGTAKKSYLGLSRSEPELALMRRVKLAIDPHGLMNPGKIFDA